MPKVSVYLPKRLHEAVIAVGLPASTICQAALIQALEDRETPTSDHLRIIAAHLDQLADGLDQRAARVVEVAADSGLPLDAIIGNLPWVGRHHPQLLIPVEGDDEEAPSDT